MNKFRTLELASSLYHNASRIKFTRASFQDQFDRALLSVVLNLSEGRGRRTAKDRRKYYHISYASLKEVETILNLSNINHFKPQTDTLSAHIWKLIQNPGSATTTDNR